jgi:hypothetical protein
MEEAEAGDLFEGEQERSDIRGWKLLLLKLLYYMGMVGSGGVLDGRPLRVLG